MKERFCCGPRSNKKISPAVSAPLHLILQAPSPASHEWKKVPGVNHLCQLCHLTVDGQGVQCKDCGLSAHSQCGSFYPPVTTSGPNIGNQYNSNNLVTTATVKGSLVSSARNTSFEPRIKKLLQVSIPVPPPNSVHSDNSHSTRLSSFGGDSASTAIIVGTATISAAETQRSESKTPEITTITPGSEVAEDPGSSSERVQQDSGCGGLLDGEEIDGISDDSHHHHQLQQLGHSDEPRLQSSLSTTEENQSSYKGPQDRRHIRYLDGPLDGALYALVNPVKAKGPSSADSGISVTVDQMKDLDRLLNALVQDAESIPDIPYHARADSLPFSYGIPDQATLRHRQEQQERRPQTQHHHQQPSPHHYSYLTHPTSTFTSQQTSYVTPPPNSTYYNSPSLIKSPPLSAPPLIQKYRTNGRSDAGSGSDALDSRNLPTPSYYPQKSHYTNNNSHLEKSNQSQYHLQQPRVHNLHLDLEEQIIPHDRGTEVQNRESEYGYYPSEQLATKQPFINRYDHHHQPQEQQNKGGVGNGRREFLPSSSPSSQPQYPSTSLPFNEFGEGSIYGNSSGKRLRSQSADGRRNERNEDADAWLARQMQRLQEKKTSKQAVRNDLLAELKRSLPTEKSVETTNQLVRPSSATRIYSRSNVSTPAWYSSDDEEFDREVEREMFQTPIGTYQSLYGGRGRKLQRFHSENAYDRIQRAPSQLSYTSSFGGEGPSNMPGFPMCPPTPYLNRPLSPGKPPRSPKATRRSSNTTPTTPTITTTEWVTSSEIGPRPQTPVNPKPVFMIESEVKFARDLSSFWYKPNASREETISALRYQRTGAFIIRNSNSFPGAYGLALKVDESTTAEDSVRHFLIEPTKYGVRLRGSAVEPVFSSLPALVYAHSIETLALPTNLTLPVSDSVLPSAQSQSTTAHLLAQGAACQLLFLGVIGVECVTGDDAVARGVRAVMGLQTPTVVSLRLSKNGLTLTDVYRQRFFRLHFPLTGISYAAVDPQNRSITYENTTRKIFAVVARPPTAVENSCVVLAELEEGQPAHAIISFFQRVIAWRN